MPNYLIVFFFTFGLRSEPDPVKKNPIRNAALNNDLSPFLRRQRNHQSSSPQQP